MTIRRITLTFAAIAIMLGGLAINSQVTAKSHEMTKYEYLIQGKRELERRESESLQGEFNNLGGQGWKLVAVLPGKEDAYSVVFMREAH